MSLSKGVLAVRFIAQSSSCSAEHLHERVLSFVEHNVQTILQGLKEEEFDTHRNALIALKLEKDKNLTQECNRHFAEINNRRYDFCRVHHIVEVVTHFTRTFPWLPKASPLWIFGMSTPLLTHHYRS